MSWNDGTATTQQILGGDIFDGQSPQVIIPANQWQRARSLGEWTLVGTTVAPAFSPDTFEMPDPGNWTPDDGSRGKSEPRKESEDGK
jgi:predicted cupin superfamily sugar epimerase